jgi:CO/xanthine dehydrogenase Mo-binding subunit
MTDPWVGRPIPQIDMADKLRGATRYIADLTLPRMLHGVIVRSPVAHGRIRRIDLSRALRVPGVRAVITGADVRAPAFGPYVPDWEVLAQDKVRFVGDDVAAVAATTLDAAREAAELVEIEIEELPAVFDALEALEPGAPLIWKERPGNIATTFEIARNDVQRGFEQADHIFEADFSTSRIYHGYLEPIATIAEYHDNGSYTLHVPTHIPLRARLVYARGLGVDTSRIRLIVPPIGGSFGAKYEMTVPLVAAALSRSAGAPVRLAFDREEDAAVNHPRPPFLFHHRVGVRDDGTFVARTTDVVGTAGARTFWSPTVLATAVHRVDSLYDFGAMSGTGRLVYTNDSPTTCMRGFGNAESLFGIEQVIDEISDRLGIDPVELRRRNAVREGQTTMHGWKISSSRLPECLDRAQKLSGYSERRRRTDWSAPQGGTRRGMGLAIAHHVSGYSAIHADFDGSSAIMRLGLDGSVTVFVGEPDLGQGHQTVLAQLAADRLGVDPAEIDVRGVDSALSPDSVGTLASRGTTMAGMAVLAAADDAKEKLAAFQARRWGADVEWSGGHVVSADGALGATLREMLKAYGDANCGLPLLAQGVHRPPTVKPDADKYGNPSAAYPFAVHVAEVEVDTATGQARVTRYWAVHDSGTIINPSTARGQVVGAVAQGIGWAFLEDVDLRDGVMRNANFLDYRIPGAGDMPPELTVEFVDGHEPNGPMGAKSLGEVAINPVTAAIANAVYDAVGVRCAALPMTPERLWAAMHDDVRPEPITEVTR